jgi:hypothetical protein
MVPGLLGMRQFRTSKGQVTHPHAFHDVYEDLYEKSVGFSCWWVGFGNGGTPPLLATCIRVSRNGWLGASSDGSAPT